MVERAISSGKDQHIVFATAIDGAAHPLFHRLRLHDVQRLKAFPQPEKDLLQIPVDLALAGRVAIKEEGTGHKLFDALGFFRLFVHELSFQDTNDL